ncbi:MULTISPECIES: hypothetical protein [Streptomyces]|uniref:hypothetical protein n=1 Tax=Streptomyces TaxID=1883 RepID=UPI001674C37E|nr:MULTISPECIES: hypothetical protein [Streptomyces]MBD3578829.1 hypothetical protein [Streptomyces sp. KD18]GGS80325.1 hypothetical protein GCM10010286_01040 [Streptomyces toxytricini]
MRDHVGTGRRHESTSSETAALTEYLAIPNPGSASPINITLLASNRPLTARRPQFDNEVGRPAGAERNRVEAADGVGVT